MLRNAPPCAGICGHGVRWVLAAGQVSGRNQGAEEAASPPVAVTPSEEAKEFPKAFPHFKQKPMAVIVQANGQARLNCIPLVKHYMAGKTLNGWRWRRLKGGDHSALDLLLETKVRRGTHALSTAIDHVVGTARVVFLVQECGEHASTLCKAGAGHVG